MTDTLFLDCETVGFNAPLLSIQWAVGFEEPRLIEVWNTPVSETTWLIRSFLKYRVTAWHLNFDWFQMVKWFNIFNKYEATYGGGIPDPALICGSDLETSRRWCIKPVEAFCQMVHFQTGPGQHLMKRDKPMIIRSVPDEIVHALAEEVRVAIRCKCASLFAHNIHVYIGQKTRREGFSDILINIRGNLGLKRVWAALTGKTTKWDSSKDVFEHSNFGKNYMPWGGDWLYTVRRMRTFTPNQKAYAKHDIVMMQDIARARDSNGNLYIEPTDENSDENSDDHILVPHNAGMRWKGVSIDVDGMLALHHEEVDKAMGVPTSPAAVKEYLSEVMDPLERILLSEEGTNKHVLKEIKGWDGEVGLRAGRVIQARHAQHLGGAIRKLLTAGGLFPQMKTVGTLTNRSAGGSHGQSKSGGSLNPTGLDSSLKPLFTLKGPGEMVSGGDFDGFEPSIASAVWECPSLHDLMSEGYKIHALFGARLFGLLYDEIMADKVLYKKSKIAMLADMYFGTSYTLHRATGLPESVITTRVTQWREEHAEVGAFYRDIKRDFSFMLHYVWTPPLKREITTILGFTRKFDIELAIAEAVYSLYSHRPDCVNSLKGLYERRKGKEQTGQGCVASALLGCLFQMQARIQRVAGNCTIQSPGGVLAKRLQRRLWDLQPIGVHPWLIRTLLVHDEPVSIHQPKLLPAIEQVYHEFIEEYREIVPLLSIGLKTDVDNWEAVK